MDSRVTGQMPQQVTSEGCHTIVLIVSGLIVIKGRRSEGVNDAHPLRLRLARNLRALRLAHGLTQEGLADLSGLHYTYIGGIERGQRNVSIDNVGRIADALGLDATDLLNPTLPREPSSS